MEQDGTCRIERESVRHDSVMLYYRENFISCIMEMRVPFFDKVVICHTVDSSSDDGMITVEGLTFRGDAEVFKSKRGPCSLIDALRLCGDTNAKTTSPLAHLFWLVNEEDETVIFLSIHEMQFPSNVGVTLPHTDALLIIHDQQDASYPIGNFYSSSNDASIVTIYDRHHIDGFAPVNITVSNSVLIIRCENDSDSDDEE